MAKPCTGASEVHGQLGSQHSAQLIHPSIGSGHEAESARKWSGSDVVSGDARAGVWVRRGTLQLRITISRPIVMLGLSEVDTPEQ